MAPHHRSFRLQFYLEGACIVWNGNSVPNTKSMMIQTIQALLVGTLLLAPIPAHAQGAPPVTETREQQEARMAWWHEAKVGMFIHWGIYSVVGGEYKGRKLPNSAEWMMCRGKIPIAEYRQYAAQFNPTKCDADNFVKMAKDAGMKYMVITA